MVQHTPGPWTAATLTGDGIVIMPTGFSLISEANAEDKANARLIAKAPAMRELLSAAFDRFTDNDMQPPNAALRAWLDDTGALLAQIDEEQR